MKCEPWMDRAPVVRRTPLQIAEADEKYWRDKQRSLVAELTACDKELDEARQRVEKLSAEEKR